MIVVNTAAVCLPMISHGIIAIGDYFFVGCAFVSRHCVSSHRRHGSQKHRSFFQLSFILNSLFLSPLSTLKARLIHGGDVQGELRSPVVLQAIATNGFNFDFITFQLNTLDFSSSEGVKNIAWIDSGPHNNIREDWRPTTWTAFRGSQRPYVLKEFNPVVFEKILATYLNGSVKWAR